MSPLTLAIATKTTLTSVNPTHASGLLRTLNAASAVLATARAPNDLVSASQAYRGAQQSLAIISAQAQLATATNAQAQAAATSAIADASANIKELIFSMNPYKENIQIAPNVVFLVVFSLLFAYYTLAMVRLRHWWFNIAFVLGFALQFIGFLGRVVSVHDITNINPFLQQYVSLTISPAFMMAGVYFVFAQLVQVYGRQYSILQPLWYAYLFIGFDVLSIIIQAIGGGLASTATSQKKDPDTGSHVIVGGIGVQVVAMTVFISLWFSFLSKLYFAHAPSSGPFRKSILGFLRLLFNTSGAHTHRSTVLETNYTHEYAGLRRGRFVDYFPLAITCALLLIYIRCVYRVVELSQGWTGYLIVHEVFLMVLDATMIAGAGIIFAVFHPMWVYGFKNPIGVGEIHRGSEDKDDVLSSDEKRETELVV